MSQSATPATQNAMTTCLETFEKDMFSSFPHRHSDATGKPETRDETRGRKKTSISCETSSNFDTFDTLSNRLECHKAPRVPRKTIWQPAWKPSKRRGLAASPIDTAMPQENQRLETRHVGASKWAFRARHPPILTLCSFKIDVFLRFFLRTWKFTTSKSMFRARLPSIFITSHKMPRLPRNLHTLATWRSPANAFWKTRSTTRLKCCACHAKWRWHVQSVAPATKTATHLLRKNIAPATQNDLRHVTKHVWMSPSPTPAMRNEATRRLKPPKMTPSITRTVANGCGRLRAVADGCERRRLRTFANVNATSSEHTLSPQTPRVKREPMLRIRE